MSFAKKALLVSSVLALGLPAASAAEKLNGAGASFPPIYQRWFAELAKSGGPQVNYQAVGSVRPRLSLTRP